MRKGEEEGNLFQRVNILQIVHISREKSSNSPLGVWLSQTLVREKHILTWRKKEAEQDAR